jgi:23S rRNA (uracil1939-C5)-methyltransferase
MARKRVSRAPYELTIDALDSSGNGLAVHEDKALTVRGALAGERVMARHLLGRRGRGLAETVEVLEPAAMRVTPPCTYFGTCSACSLQHMDLPDQLQFKQDVLLKVLAEQGVAPEKLLAPLAAERWSYRRKARLSVRYVKGKGRVLVGFREHDGRFVTDMLSCQTLHPLVAEALPALSELVESLDASDRLPQIEASCGDDSAALVLRHLDPLSDRDQRLLNEFEKSRGLRIYLQPKGPDTVHALNDGPSQLSYTLPEEALTFAFEPLDFVQVNTGLNRAMIAQAMALLAPQKGERALDLFCGLGNFTLPLAKRCGDVLGLEAAPNLLHRAGLNARANGVEGVEFMAADLYGEELAASWPAGTFDLVMLDPPRSGAAAVLAHIAATGASRVLYVSCNPDTLAQDARAMVSEHGYVLAAAGAMDMFPQTSHIEAMALFEKPRGDADGA